MAANVPTSIGTPEPGGNAVGLDVSQCCLLDNDVAGALRQLPDEAPGHYLSGQVVCSLARPQPPTQEPG